MSTEVVSLHANHATGSLRSFCSSEFLEVDKLQAQYDRAFNNAICGKNSSIAIAGLLKEKPFLEIGCGSHTVNIKSRLPVGTSLHCVESDRAKVSRIQAKLGTAGERGVTFHAFDALDMSNFEDNTFCGAFVSWTLERLSPENVQELLNELRRVVAPGGQIVISSLILAPDESIRSNATGKCPRYTKYFTNSFIDVLSRDHGNANFGQKSVMLAALKASGFPSTSVEYHLRPLHHLDNDDLQLALQDILIDILASAVPLLDRLKLFPEGLFHLVEDELRGAKDIMLHYGQVNVLNDK